jgi:hypothetical protein
MMMLAVAAKEAMPMIALVGGLAIALVMIVGQLVKSTLAQRAREQSRREIAAYVAEGSMTAEEGARLMDAGLKSWEREKH